MASTLDYLRTEKRDAILALARKHGISLVSEAIHRSGSHAAMTKHFFAHVIYILESDEFWDGETERRGDGKKKNGFVTLITVSDFPLEFCRKSV
jgi:hypothetical protein